MPCRDQPKELQTGRPKETLADVSTFQSTCWNPPSALRASRTHEVRVIHQRENTSRQRRRSTEHRDRTSALIRLSCPDGALEKSVLDIVAVATGLLSVAARQRGPTALDLRDGRSLQIPGALRTTLTKDETNPESCLYATSWGVWKGNSGNRDPRGELLEAADCKCAVGNSPPLWVSGQRRLLPSAHEG